VGILEEQGHSSTVEQPPLERKVAGSNPAGPVGYGQSTDIKREKEMSEHDEEEMRAAEDLYDTEIAPLLLQVGQMCEDAGFSFVAMVEWLPGETGITHSIREGAGASIRLTDMAALSRGNFDSLCTKAIRYGKEHGHNSVFINMLDRLPL
jgi:hypothetical protein